MMNVSTTFLRGMDTFSGIGNSVKMFFFLPSGKGSFLRVDAFSEGA